MLDGSVLAAGGGFSFAQVRCPGASAGFAQPEEERGHVLVAACRGAFVRRVAGREVFVDGSVAYLSAPGTVEELATASKTSPPSRLSSDSDHSRLTRTIRAATGHPPAACRALLTGQPPKFTRLPLNPGG